MDKKWILRYLQLAEHIATWSKDPSTKVGAVIIAPNNVPISFGFNGFPRGFEDSDERYIDKEFKHRHVIHAETNAILNARGSVEGCSIFVTHPPCQHCAGSIAQSGIARVYAIEPDEAFRERWDMDATLQVFNETNVEFYVAGRKDGET